MKMPPRKENGPKNRRRSSPATTEACRTSMLAIDDCGTIVAASHAFQQYSGFASGELSGMGIGAFLGEEAESELLTLLSGSLQREYCRFLPVSRKKGRPASFVVCGITLPQPAPATYLLTITDTSAEKTLQATLRKSRKELQEAISARDREIREFTSSLIETNVDLRREIRENQLAAELLRQSEARFRNLTETTSDFIWEIDREWRYTYASPKISKLLGYRPEELIGKQFLMLQDPAMSARFTKEIVQCPDMIQGFSGWQYRCLHREGRTVIVESSAEPIIGQKGKIIGFRGIDRDNTERVTYENRLMEAKEIAESADRAKSEFLANMSHELRTPLHAILSFARHGTKKIGIGTREDLLKYFQQIESSANRLLPLINSVLDLAKLEARKMPYDIVHDSILPEIELAVDEIIHLAAQKKVEIAIERAYGQAPVYFDRAAVGNIIRNLLSNAVKFCRDNSTITIAFAITTDNYHRQVLRTTVANTGIPIPENELESIFDKFVQSSRTKTGAGGTGLGLAICRQIMIDLHGMIWAENGEDGRALFHFTLPITKKPGKIGQILLDRGLVTREDLEDALLDQKGI